MKCPNCGLLNPPTALRCDCRYDFPSRAVKESYLPQKEKDRLRPWRRWYWPEIHDPHTAKQAAEGASIAAFLVGAGTAAVAVLSLFGINVLGISAWALVDAAIFAALGAGIWRGSRICAVVAPALYVIEVAQMATRGGRLGIVTIVIVLYFIGGVRGTYLDGRSWQANPSFFSWYLGEVPVWYPCCFN